MKINTSQLKKWFLGISISLYGSLAFADLPKAKESDKANDGDYIGLGTETSGDLVELVVQGVGAAILVGAAYAMISSFMDVQNKKATYADFGKTLGAGMVACVIGIILLTQAKAIFS